MSLVLLLAGCQRYARADLAVVAGDPGATADECAFACFTVDAGAPEVAVVASVDGHEVARAVSGDDGLAELCPTWVAPGVGPMALRAGAATLSVDVDVRPFGWSAGIEKEAGEAEVAAPALTLPDDPLLEPSPGTWYARQVTHPHVSDDGLFAFAGSDELADEGEQLNPYQLGLARFDGDAVTDVSAAPLFADAGDAWGMAARNSPEVHRGADGRLALWFHGRDGADDRVQIGRALSDDDGGSWSLDGANPVFALEGGVMHPTLVDHGGGVWELWYEAPDGIGHALSGDDGATWTPYCANPVVPQPAEGLQKAPFVLRHEGRYVMALTRGVSPAWATWWAESLDGLRWTLADGPMLEAGSAAWLDQGVASAQVLVEDDGLALLFVGTGAGGRSGIGIAR